MAAGSNIVLTVRMNNEARQLFQRTTTRTRKHKESPSKTDLPNLTAKSGRNQSQIISGARDFYLVCGSHVTAGGRPRDHVYTVMRPLLTRT